MSDLDTDPAAPQRPLRGIPSPKKVAYIMGTYPILTTTFIDREIIEAKRLGLNMLLMAIRRSSSTHFTQAVQELMRETTYLLPVPIWRLFAAHLHFLLSRPQTYFGTLWHFLRCQHPSLRARFKTMLHFGEGVLAASMLQDKAVRHVHAHFADRAAVIAMTIHRLNGIPYSLTAHAVDIYVAPAFLSEKIVNAKFATTCTGYNKRYLETTTGHAIELIYHGLDFTDIPPVKVESHPPSGRPLILSVGQLKEKKGFRYLIEACGLLRESGYEFACEIVGEGPTREELHCLIDKLGLSDVITLLGALPHADVLRKYSQATLFTLPCIVAEDGNRDGIPNVILEAMAYGLPVISTNVSGIPEAVLDRETGWLIEPRDAQALSRAIAWVLDNRDDAALIGRSASAFVRRQFDIRQNVARLIELFA